MTLKSAIGLLIQLAPKPRTEKVFLCDALDKVAAEDVVSDMDFPPFSRAAGNVLCAYLSEGTKTVQVIGETFAGDANTFELYSGEALICNSGAIIPGNANFVCKLNARMQVGKRINISNLINIFDKEVQASICNHGELLVSHGTRITPANLPLLAQCGVYEPVIYSKPIVTHFAIGTELVEPPFTPRNSQVRNTNSTFLNSLLKKSNANSDYLGLVPDNLDRISAFIHEGLETSDIVMITGGTAYGKYDLTKQAIINCGFEIAFDKVDFYPGKNTIFAHKDGKVILALPGKPFSLLVAFQLIAKHLIALSGGSEHKAFVLNLELDSSYHFKIKRFPTYLPGKINSDMTVSLLPQDFNTNTVSIAQCNCLVSIGNEQEISKCKHVNCIMISEFI